MSKAIFETFLDELEQSFLQRSFEGYAAHIQLPFLMATQSSQFVVTDMEALRAGFESWCDFVAARQADEVVRTALDVELLGDELLVGQYATRMLRRGELAVPEFTSALTLRRIDGRWRGLHLASGMTSITWPIAPEVIAGDAED